MAESPQKPYDGEIRFPLFTVVKNDSIIRNIFLNVFASSDSETSQEIIAEEIIVLVGRHPDCQIVLFHPSISRFHLEIRWQPSLQKLFVTDLFSAHGTWVFGQKLEPKVPRELMEGDELTFGTSRRTYRLRWVSCNQAQELEEGNANMLHDENPKLFSKEDFWPVAVIPSAPPLPESSHNVNPDAEYVAVEIPNMVDADDQSLRRCSPKLQDVSVPDEPYSAGAMLKNPEKCSSPIQFDGRYQPTKGTGLHDVPFVDDAYSAAKLVKKLNEASCQMQDDGEKQIPERRPLRLGGISLEEANCALQMSKQPEQASKDILLYGDSHSSPRSDRRLRDVSGRESIGSSLPFKLSPDKLLELEKENHITKVLLVREMQSEKGNQSQFISLLEHGEPSEKESVSPSLPVQFLSLNLSPFNGKHKSPAVVMDRKALVGHGNGRLKQQNVSVAESLSSSMPETLQKETEIQVNCKNQSQKASLPNVLAERENRSPSPSLQNRGSSTIWSRRSKSASFLRVQTGKSTQKTAIEAHINKENTDVEVQEGRKSFCKVLFPGAGQVEDSFASDKENMTPKLSVSAGNSKKRNDRELKREEVNISPSKFMDLEEETFASDKENLTPKVLREKKQEKLYGSQTRFKAEARKRATERIPFQTLPDNPLDGSGSIPNATSKTDYSNNFTQKTTTSNNTSASTPTNQITQIAGENKKKWHMVVDMTCFLDEVSRRSLKLLEGLKGTHLIIPRMVIRELDYLKRRGSWFKKSAVVCSILQWIEDCMVKTNWWIHVQSSGESLPVAPTPPSSPHSWFSEESSEFGVRPAGGVHGRLQEIVSPTAEDHVLESALLFKKIYADQQVVLLTNDISLKIKAMAEGLLCETATEFRESLVNPYSERFLWVESIPRGPTWSCLEEAAYLKESFSHYWPSAKRTTKAGEGAKGLKLILTHNSHYGQMYSVR